MAITWKVSYAGCKDCPPFVNDPDDANDDSGDVRKALFEKMAVELLHNWTGYGTTDATITVDPLRITTASTYNGLRGSTPCAAALPTGIVKVTKLVVNGEDIANWDVYGNIVSWGGCSCCLSSTLCSCPPEVEVTGTFGRTVPPGGEVAAGVLACELAKAACNDASCALPQRVQTVTREGVTVAVLDQFADMEKGRTGIWIIDSWVTSVKNPIRPSSVLSPDTGAFARVRNG